MSQAARSYYGSAAPRRESRPSTRPDVRVIPGRGASNPAYKTLHKSYVTGFRVALIVIAVVALFCGVRIMFASATVDNLQSIQKLESQVTASQAKARELEITHSKLASSARIESEAKELGMTSPDKVTYIKVDLKSTVATNADGTVSLAGTIANIESSAVTASK